MAEGKRQKAEKRQFVSGQLSVVSGFPIFQTAALSRTHSQLTFSNLSTSYLYFPVMAVTISGNTFAPVFRLNNPEPLSPVKPLSQ